MSISILALPFAIAAMPVLGIMRVTMGKEKFNQWLNSNNIFIPTTIKDRDQLTLAVKRAGYDANDWGSSIKTHITPDLWFFWEIHNGTWAMCITKTSDKDKILAFMKRIEQANGHPIFQSSQLKEELVTVLQKRTTQLQNVARPKVSHALPTIFTDHDLLLSTLQEFDETAIQTNGDEILCSVNGFDMKFLREDTTKPYELHIQSEKDLQEFQQAFEMIQSTYQGNVQENVYLHVKTTLEEKAIPIESEDILDDNSIVLTVNI